MSEPKYYKPFITMFYEQIALQESISSLAHIQIILGKITDEPEVTQAVQKIKEATAKLVEVEKGVSDYMEERR